MNAFIEVLKSFGALHPIASFLILLFGFPEVEIIILIIIGVLALAAR